MARSHFLKINTESFYIIIMVVSVFGGIVVIAYWWRAISTPYSPIAWRDVLGCHWIHASVISYSHGRYFEHYLLHFLCVLIRGSSFIRALRNYMFQQDNVRPHIAGTYIVRNFSVAKPAAERE